MIHWLQTRFKKHTTVVLAFLLIAVAIPFVFSIGNGVSVWNRDDGRLKRREFFGHNLASQVEVGRLTADARLSIMLRVGYQMPAEGRQVEDQAYQRAAGLALDERLHLGQPTGAALNAYIASLRLFQNEQGVFDPSRYERFRQEVAKGGEWKEADIARVLAEDIRIQRVNRLLAGPGYVPEIEVGNEMTFGTTEWFLLVAVLDLDALPKPSVPAKAVLERYYAEHLGDFTQPERVKADYVRFAAADFVSTVPPEEAEVVEYFTVHRQQFMVPGRTEDPALADVRPQVEQALQTAKAKTLAATTAADFAYELYEKQIAPDAPALDGVIAAHKGQLASAPLFERGSLPPGLGWSKEIAESALDLGPTRCFSDVLSSGDDSIVLVWRESFPRTQPELAEIWDRVHEAYSCAERNRMLRLEAAGWPRAVKAMLATKRSFADAVEALPGMPAHKIVRFGPFSRVQQPDGLPAVVLKALGNSATPAVLDLVLDEKQAYLVYVAGKRAPAVDRKSEEYARVRAQLEASAAGSLGTQIIHDLVQEELERDSVATSAF